MKSAAVVLPLVGLAASANAWSNNATTTKVVTAFTTYCPYPTTWSYKNDTYTVTKPTTITITNCPCTLSVSTPPPYTTTIPCNTTAKPWGNTTYPPTTTVVTPPPTTYLGVTTVPVTTVPLTTPASSKPPTTSSPPFVTANVGAHVGSGIGALAFVGVMAAYLL